MSNIIGTRSTDWANFDQHNKMFVGNGGLSEIGQPHLWDKLVTVYDAGLDSAPINYVTNNTPGVFEGNTKTSGGAWDFDGTTNTKLRINDNDAMNFNTLEFTLSVWIMRTGTWANFDIFAGRGNFGGRGWFLQGWPPHKPTINYRSGGNDHTTISDTPLVLNELTHLVFRGNLDTNRVDIYTNGVQLPYLSQSIGAVGVELATGEPFVLGGYDYSDLHPPCKIYQFAAWDRTLSLAEIGDLNKNKDVLLSTKSASTSIPVIIIDDTIKEVTASNAVSFTQSSLTNGVYAKTASNAVVFAQELILQGVVLLTASNTLTFAQSDVTAGPINVTASNAITFSGFARNSTLQVTASNAITFTQANNIVGEKEVTASNTITFGQNLTNSLKVLTAGNTLTLSQTNQRVKVIAGASGLTATSPITFTQSNNRIHCLTTATTLTGSNTITFTSNAILPKELTASNTITFTNTADRFPHPTASNTITFSQTSVLNMVRSLTATSTVAFQHSFTGGHFRNGVLISENTTCKSIYEYAPFAGGDSPVIPATTPILTKLDDVIFYYPSGLIGAATDSITLRTPNFGDRDRNQYNRINRESRGGSLTVFRDADWPSQRSFVMDFSGVKDSEVSGILEFLETSLGKEIGFRDWKDRTWYGIITNPDTAVIRQGTNRNDVSFEFEVNQLV